MNTLKRIVVEMLQDENGEFSHLRVWESVAYLTLTIIVLYLAFMKSLSFDMAALYVGTLSVRGGYGKFIDAKYNKKTPE